MPSQEIQRISEYLDTQDKALIKAILRDFRSIQNNVSVDDIIVRLKNGDDAAALTLLSNEAVMSNASSEALTNSFLAAGLFSMRLLRTKTTALIEFDPTERFAADAFRTYKQQTLNYMNVTTRNGLQFYLQGLRQRNMPETLIAQQLINSVGLTQAQQQAVLNYRQMLENRSFDALRAELRNRELDSFISSMFRGDNDLTLTKINQLVRSYQDNFRTHRAINIGRTEATRIYNLTQMALLEKMITSGDILEDDVVRFWVHMRDEKVRASHRAVPSLNPGGVSFNESFKTPLGPLRYPGDPLGTPQNVINCRCVLRIELRDEANV